MQSTCDQRICTGSGRRWPRLAAWIATAMLFCLYFGFAQSGSAQTTQKHADSGIHKQRMIVLTDIGAEADDTESTVRLLLYSDVIDIKGLIATTSIWKRTSVSPELIDQVIHAYAKVHANLVKHDPNYPTAEALEAVLKRGWPQYGMSGVGDGKDSEGSDWIIKNLEQNDDRPLWITVWGGANTLAQALYKLRATKSPAEVDRLVAKLRVYTISDQDDSGPWMRKNFPKLFYIVSPGGDYNAATWTGINTVVPGIDNATIGNKWLAEHIQQGHGPLGAEYPDVAYGMEGDTPSWLALIPNGLNDPEHPDWGGWGGRYELYLPTIDVADPKTFIRGVFIDGVPIEAETRPIWTNATDDSLHRLSGNTAGRHGPATSRSATSGHPSGAGGTTSKTILPRAWIGLQSPIKKPTILPFLSSILPKHSRSIRAEFSVERPRNRSRWRQRELSSGFNIPRRGVTKARCWCRWLRISTSTTLLRQRWINRRPSTLFFGLQTRAHRRCRATRGSL